jgi:tricorn protease
MRKLLFAAALAFVLPAALFPATKLLRHPAYHNGKVAFSYLGDIWIANEDATGLQRLTVHKARDIFPRFSPDGRWIAFSSNREGNYDVFVIPVQGGVPKQLTFHAANDTVVGWTPDSRKVVFQSSRGRVLPSIPNLYEVPVEGGLEQPIPTDWGAWGSYSPDGSKFAFNRHSPFWWRRHFRGSSAADLWVLDLANRKFSKLGDGEYKGNYFWPMYGSKGDIYFVADRLPNEKDIRPGSAEVMKSVSNIWKISERGGSAVQITHHSSGQLFFPSISSDGRVIVYEENSGLWKLDTASGKSAEIKLDIPSDDKENQLEVLAIHGEADSFCLSPSTRRAAISTHGEVFTIPTGKGEVQQVTRSYFRDTNPVWSPDGKWIAFLSDRSGRQEVWIDHERGGSPAKLSDSDMEKSDLEWAPDSKSLLYSASDQNLYRVSVETRKTEVIASSEIAPIVNPRFSPDGKWISYTKSDRGLRSRVYVIPSAGGEEHHVGREDLFNESGARWTADGKELIFLAAVMGPGSRPVRSLYAVALADREKNPVSGGIDIEEEAQARPVPDNGQPSSKPAEVKIDWEGLSRRVRPVTRIADSVADAVPSPDSRFYAFTAAGQQGSKLGSALYTIRGDGEQMIRVAGGQPISSPQFSRDGKTLYYLSGNGIYGTPADRVSEPRRVSFLARVEVDQRAERKQILNESWRLLKYRFYDPEMHGANWAGIQAAYEPLTDYVADQEELHDLISRMIGELNASHTGITPGASEAPSQTQARYPGFELEPDPSGYYRVSHVYKDGPADKDYVRIRTGDYLIAIGGRDVKAGENYWKLYNAPPRTRMEFTLNSKPAREGAWTTEVEPVGAGSYGILQYEKWLAERAAIVDKLSGGQIGYLHIESMGQENLRRFEHDLANNHFKKGLIIDVRFNGGGGIDQQLLQILQQRQYQSMRRRGSIQTEHPQSPYYGPMVVLQNERSASDTEIFADGFRTLGLGKIVGVTSLGAVIGTRGNLLLDGSTIRTPTSGFYTMKGQNLENYGIPPDVYVDNSPEDFFQGRDAQLEKCVQLLQMKPVR